jgi:hypothetical protein
MNPDEDTDFLDGHFAEVLGALQGEASDFATADYVARAVQDAEEAFEQEDEEDRRAGTRVKYPCEGSRRIPKVKVQVKVRARTLGDAPVGNPARTEEKLQRFAAAHHSALKTLHSRILVIEEKPRSLLPLPGWKAGCAAAVAVPVIMFLMMWFLGFFILILEALGLVQNG